MTKNTFEQILDEWLFGDPISIEDFLNDFTKSDKYTDAEKNKFNSLLIMQFAGDMDALIDAYEDGEIELEEGVSAESVKTYVITVVPHNPFGMSAQAVHTEHCIGRSLHDAISNKWMKCKENGEWFLNWNPRPCELSITDVIKELNNNKYGVTVVTCVHSTSTNVDCVNTRDFTLKFD